METDDHPARTGNRGTGSNGDALPDRAAGQREMIVRRDRGCKAMYASACGRALVRDDGAVRKEMADNLSGGSRIERPRRNIRPTKWPDVQRLPGCLHGVGERLKGARPIFVRMSKVKNFCSPRVCTRTVCLDMRRSSPAGSPQPGSVAPFPS